MELKCLEDLIKVAQEGEKQRLVVAASADKHVLEAVKGAYEIDVITPILIGNYKLTKALADEIGFKLEKIEIVDEPNDKAACKIAVSYIKEKKADILMKGLVSTAPLLKAVLDKENGLRSGDTLSHFALMESPYYHKLIGVTDAAMNVMPEINDKVAIINNSVKAIRGIGIKKPKVAVLGPVETVNPKISCTIDAAMLSQMNKRGQIKNCLVDGPLAFDNAISKKACEIKKITTEVGGDADILVAPDLSSANILYKSLSFMGDAKAAAVILGAKCPIVLTSRADSKNAKLFSIVLSAAMIEN